MFDRKILYKVLRYLLQTIIIYLVLRYTPYINLDVKKSIIITVILTVFIASLELIYMAFYSRNNDTEPFKANCDVCKLPTIVPDNTHKCRIVCDGSDNNTKIENFTPSPETHTANKQHAHTAAKTQEHAHTHTAVKTQEHVPTKPVQEEAPAAQNVTSETANNVGFDGMFYDNYVGSRNTGSHLNSPEHVEERRTLEEVAYQTNKRNMHEQAYSTAGYSTPYQDPGAKSQTRQPIDHSRRIEGNIDDDLPYSDYNHLPVAAGYKSHDYEYGYNFLPPEKWFKSNPTPPICITDRRSTVYPVLANGTPADVKEFHSSLKVMPPNRTSINYIEDKLNNAG